MKKTPSALDKFKIYFESPPLEERVEKALRRMRRQEKQALKKLANDLFSRPHVIKLIMDKFQRRTK